MLVQDLMTAPPVTVTPRTTATRAMDLMAERGLTALPVVDDAGRLVGVVSEVDVIDDRFPHAPPDTAHRLTRPPATVGELMSTPAVAVAPEAGVDELVHLMWRHRHHWLPVVRDGRVTGVVTRRDVVRELARDPFLDLPESPAHPTTTETDPGRA